MARFDIQCCPPFKLCLRGTDSHLCRLGQSRASCDFSACTSGVKDSLSLLGVLLKRPMREGAGSLGLFMAKLVS